MALLYKIEADTISTVWSWRKGSKIQGMNTVIASMIQLWSQRHIHIQAIHIPGVINHPTHNNFQLDRTVFHQVCSQLHFYPDTDFFASRQNPLCKQYCSWQTDTMSKGNAWSIHWGKLNNS